jgi:hypothetical protein
LFNKKIIDPRTWWLIKSRFKTNKCKFR